MGIVLCHVASFSMVMLQISVDNLRGDLLNLVLSSGWIARAVIIVLLLFSIISWGIILQKYLYLKAVNHASGRFIRVFQNYGAISDTVQASQKYKRAPLARVFFAAYTEYQRYTVIAHETGSPRLQKPEQISLVLESTARCMRNASMLERNRLEKNLIFLATTGGVTPFIGLFGTVWGIMNAFRGIGMTGSANLATVAPGIAEALIATAAGLFAAIPGVIAYNYFQRKVTVFNMELEYFSADVLNYLQHHYLYPQSKQKVSTGESTA